MHDAKSLVIVAHKFLTQPDDELVVYLNEKSYKNVLHVMHSFSDAPDRCSYYRWYRNGRIYRERRTRDYRYLPEPLLYVKEMVFTLVWIISTGVKWDIFIGMDGLCVLWGNALRGLTRVGMTVYWAIDFVPEKRFVQRWKEKIYLMINKAGYRNADQVWDLSPRMKEARGRLWGASSTTYRKHQIVPYGVWTERISRRTYNECDQDTLVFVGHLLEKQGVQLVLHAMPEILKRRPNFNFKIIGAGAYYESLLNLANRLGASSSYQFMGKIEDIRVLEDEVAKSCVAIAPYISKLDRWTYYADPGKVKTYLACGVPVLLTAIPWNAREIEEKKCGMIIQEDVSDIVEKVLFLMDRKNNQTFRDNAIGYATAFDYQTIFGKLPIF